PMRGDSPRIAPHSLIVGSVEDGWAGRTPHHHFYGIRKRNDDWTSHFSVALSVKCWTRFETHMSSFPSLNESPFAVASRCRKIARPTCRPRHNPSRSRKKADWLSCRTVLQVSHRQPEPVPAIRQGRTRPNRSTMARLRCPNGASPKL